MSFVKWIICLSHTFLLLRIFFSNLVAKRYILNLVKEKIKIKVFIFYYLLEQVSKRLQTFLLVFTQPCTGKKRRSKCSLRFSSFMVILNVHFRFTHILIFYIFYWKETRSWASNVSHLTLLWISRDNHCEERKTGKSTSPLNLSREQEIRR